jgi:hypothetical protein
VFVFLVVSFLPVFPPISCMRSYSLHPPDFIILITLGEEYKLCSSSSCSFLHPPVTPPLFGPNILLSTVLKHPWSMIVPQWDRPSFTPIQNQGQNYSLPYYANYEVLRQQTGRQKVLDRIVANITGIQSVLYLLLKQHFDFFAVVPRHLNCDTFWNLWP